MSTVRVYKNLLAQNVPDDSEFSLDLNAGTLIEYTGFEIRHAYSMDAYTRCKWADSTSTGVNGYAIGAWTGFSSSNDFNAFYVHYGANIYIDLIDIETIDPETGPWSRVTLSDVFGEGGESIVTSGVYVNNPTGEGRFIVEFNAVSNTRRKYRVAMRKDPSDSSLGTMYLHQLMPLGKLDLPEPARTRVESPTAYGTNQEYTLGGKTQYTSYGVRNRVDITINYEYISEAEKDLLVSLYQSQKGSTYPFAVRVTSEVYAVIFSQPLVVIEEQAGLYMVTLNLESL